MLLVRNEFSVAFLCNFSLQTSFYISNKNENASYNHKLFITAPIQVSYGYSALREGELLGHGSV
jgi:hypothetical protein